MNLRALAVAAVCVVVCGWWWSHRVPAPPLPAVGASVVCPPPPGVVSRDVPLQSPVPDDFADIRLRPATLQALAGFSIQARVLSREDYAMGREAELSPTDLALGWGRMREDDVLSKLSFDQSGRWYHYRWQGAPPIPVNEIVRSSANMHMIPSDATVARELARVREGDSVRIDGWLVQANGADGWRWRSSLTRNDSGGGSCEVVYVCSIVRD